MPHLKNRLTKKERKTMLLLNKTSQEVKRNIPITIIYNRTLTNIKSIVEKHWHVLQVNPEFKEIFQSSPLMAFSKSTNLKQIIGSNTIEHNKKVIKFNNKLNGKCLANTRTLCCKQVASITSFKNNQTKCILKSSITSIAKVNM